MQLTARSSLNRELHGRAFIRELFPKREGVAGWTQSGQKSGEPGADFTVIRGIDVQPDEQLFVARIFFWQFGAAA